MLLDSSLCCGSSCCHFSIRRHQSHLGLSEDRWQEGWEAAAPGLCWRELLQVKVTGAGSCSPGAPDTPQQLPLRDAASAHLFTGSGKKKSAKLREVLFPSSPIMLLLYFVTLMWKIVGGMKYWCDPMCLILRFAVRVQVLSGSISQKYTWRKVLAERREVRLISCRKAKSFRFIIEHFITVHGLYYSGLHTQKCDICRGSSLFSPLCFFASLASFFLPGWHPSPCGRPAHLWQLCQCKLLQSVWAQGEQYLQGCPSPAQKDPE